MIATLATDIHSAGKKNDTAVIAAPPAKGIADFWRQP